jgi:pimeloyl-ACP methyl ester carboxylesterase
MTSQAYLAEKFIVVAYDQRGTGGSYFGAKADSLTIKRMCADIKELTEYLCEKFDKKKLFLIGGSWGTELGTFFIKEHPERIIAYIGIGQTVDGVKNEENSWNFAFEKATAANDIKSIKTLNEVGPPVKGVYKDGVKGLMKERNVLNKYGGFTTSKGLYASFVKPILLSKEYTLRDKIGIIFGTTYTLKTMWADIVNYDFQQTHTEFEVPYYIMQGRLDNTTSAALIEDFYNAVSAPKKGLIWFENSAHHPQTAEKDKFIEELDKIIINNA